MSQVRKLLEDFYYHMVFRTLLKTVVERCPRGPGIDDPLNGTSAAYVKIGQFRSILHHLMRCASVFYHGPRRLLQNAYHITSPLNEAAGM